MYLHENPAELRQLVAATAAHYDRAEPYIEKDYYAMMMLREVVKRNPDLVFKGGTCLSKCYKAIERFSEDVDLGIVEEHATEGMLYEDMPYEEAAKVLSNVASFLRDTQALA